MPLLAKEHLPIPTKDLTSWCYDNRSNIDVDKPIYVDTVTLEGISSNQAFAYIRKLVAGFRALGLQKGDCVCIHSFNHLYYPILVHGIVAFGGVFVGTNPSYTAHELHHALKTSRAKLIISGPDLLAAPRAAAAALGIPDTRILILADEGSARHASWRTLLQHGSRDWYRFDSGPTARDTTAFLMFSSGTTGLPKAAELSHFNLVAQHTLVHERQSEGEGEGEAFATSMVGSLPFFHIAQASYTHVSSLRAGLPTYVMRRFGLDAYLGNVGRFDVTRLVLVPPMVVAIVNAAAAGPGAEERVRRCLSGVYVVIGAGAPLDRETQARLQRLLPPRAACTQLWAMTETSCVATYFPYPEKDDTGSVGRFIPNMDVKLVDDGGEEVGPYDVRGELCVRGPTIVRGYFENPEANKRDWDADGFFHTGDIVYCDSKSKLWYVVDRKKELIKVRGFQVAPSELEGVLLAHPGVMDVAVIGVHSGDAGELPRAYIVRSPKAKLTEHEADAWMKERLASYKRLDGGIKFVDSIPKSASGKILKRVLRDEASKELSMKL